MGQSYCVKTSNVNVTLKLKAAYQFKVRHRTAMLGVPFVREPLKRCPLSCSFSQGLSMIRIMRTGNQH